MPICPYCGAEEIAADTPYTVYACGSSDYDQRPGTFNQSDDCFELVQEEQQRTINEIANIIRDDVCALCPNCSPEHEPRCEAAYKRQAKKIFGYISRRVNL